MEADFSLFWTPGPGEDAWKQPLRRAIAEESVLHLDDLLLRRSSLGDHPGRANRLAAETCRLFDWDAQRQAAELARLSRIQSPAVKEPPAVESDAR